MQFVDKDSFLKDNTEYPVQHYFSEKVVAVNF